MRRFARIAAIVLLIWPCVSMAQDWKPLDGAGVRVALEGRRLNYDDGAWQTFTASGRTFYNAGGDSWGNWRIVGDQYCSQWPPSDAWACYDVDANGKSLRFVGSSGEITVGEFP